MAARGHEDSLREIGFLFERAQRRQHDHTGAWFSSFQGPVWSTAFDVRALLASGLAATDPRIAQALDWLADAQILIPQPAVNNTHAGAPRVGGYAFQPTNETMPSSGGSVTILAYSLPCLPRGIRKRELVIRRT